VTPASFFYSISTLVLILGEYQESRRCVWPWESCILAHPLLPPALVVGFIATHSKHLWHIK